MNDNEVVEQQSNRIDTSETRIDHDLELVEEMADRTERGRFALDLVREGLGSESSDLYRGVSKAHPLRETPTWGIHYNLPDMAGDGWGTVRPAEHETTTVNEGGTHLMLTVPQETMWRVDRDSSPYLHASLSECSLLIGKTDDSLWVAHIGFSMSESLNESFEAMHKAGVDVDAMVVVASVGKRAVREVPEGKFGHPATLDDYTALGINPDRIVPFEFAFGDGEEVTHRNITEVLVNDHEVYAQTGDWLITYGSGSKVPVMVGAPTAEAVLSL